MRAPLFLLVALASIAIACTVTLPFDELTDGTPRPIAHYAFEEGSGLTPRDGVGANHAVFGDEFGNLPRWTREGRRGGAVDFAREDGWLEAPTLADANFPLRATYAAWVRFPALDDDDSDLLEVDDDTETEERTPIYLGVANSGVYLTFHEGPTNAGEERTLVAPPIAVGNWTFIAAGWDIPAKKAFIYVRPEGEAARPLVTGDLPPAFAIRAGYLIFMAGGGRLDEVKIFDLPLVANQLDTVE
jgi:hypothetical protein